MKKPSGYYFYIALFLIGLLVFSLFISHIVKLLPFTINEESISSISTALFFLAVIGVYEYRTKALPKKREQKYLSNWTEHDGSWAANEINWALPEGYKLNRDEYRFVEDIYPKWIEKAKSDFFSYKETSLNNKYYKDELTWFLTSFDAFCDNNPSLFITDVARMARTKAELAMLLRHEELNLSQYILSDTRKQWIDASKD